MSNFTFEQLLSTPRGRLDSLTGMRWWAAFGVFAFHMLAFADLPHLGPYANWGYMGVAFFFILSGFVITWSYRASTTAATFYWRRIGRIYPSHLVALCLALPVFYSRVPDPSEPWVRVLDWKIISLSLPLLQGWSSNQTVMFSGNPVAWTLCLEFFFYALTPLVFMLIKRCKLWGAWALAGLSALSVVAIQVGLVMLPDWFNLLPMPIRRLPEYLLGIALAWLIMGGVRVKIPPTIPLALSLLLVTFDNRWANLVWDYAIVRTVAVYSVQIITLLLALMIYGAAVRDLNGGFSTYRLKPIVTLGEWSYCFYLLHFTVLYVMLDAFGFHNPSWSNLKYYGLTMLLVIFAAGGLHNAVEKPCERWIKAWRTRHDAARNAMTPSAGITKG